MDLSLLYYTANRIKDRFSKRVRDHLISITQGKIPVISISQKPMNFGLNIHVGDIGFSTYNIYKQILIGAKAATTEFVACCEDDSLYNEEHLSFRPLADEIAYNINRWTVDSSGIYFTRGRVGMCMCIAPRELLIRTLEERFEKFPVPLDRVGATGWGEPGKVEERLGLPIVKLLTFRTNAPTITFNHRGLGGRRKILPTDIVSDELPEWGRADELWRTFCG